MRANNCRIRTVLDGLSDLAVVGFAEWVLFDLAATVFQLPATTVFAGWLILLAVTVVAITHWRDRLREPAQNQPAQTVTGPSHRSVIKRISWALAIIASILAVTLRGSTWFISWGLGAAAVGLGLGAHLRDDLRSAPGPRDEARNVANQGNQGSHRSTLVEDLVALVAAVFTAIMSWVIVRPSPDDVFYVNRAEAVDALNRIPVRDVLLSYQRFPAVGGTGNPVDSIDPLGGVIAHVLHVSAATVMYEFVPPAVTFLAVWALWRVVRTFAIRRRAGCFAVGLVFIYMSGRGQLSFGDFTLLRPWQGKAALVSWLLPTLVVSLVAWLRKPSLRLAIVIAAGGLAGVGLSSTGTFDIPILVIAVAVVPLVYFRRWLDLVIPIVCAAAAAIPGSIGAVVAPPGVHQINNLRSQLGTFNDVLGVGLIAAVAILAIWVGPMLVGDRFARAALTGLSGVVVFMLAPEFIHALHAASNVGGVLRRVMFVVPVPALVGLLASIELPVPSHMPDWIVQPAPAIAISVALLATATSVFSMPQVTLVSRPTWKIRGSAAAAARHIIARVGEGIVLAPSRVMSDIAIASGNVVTVNPRGLYTSEIPQPRWSIDERFGLTKLADNAAEPPSPSRAAHDLRRLHVGWVCLYRDSPEAVRVVAHDGLLPAFDAGGLDCYRRVPSDTGVLGMPGLPLL